MSFLSKLFHSINTTQQSKNTSSQQYVNIFGYNSKATLYKMDTLEEIESIPVPTSPFKYRCDFTKSIEYVLQRKATQFKREGNMDCAIACLKKALEIIPYAPMNYTNVETRLENYLKIARRFSEAEALKNTQTENMRVSTFPSILSVQNMNDMIEVPKCSRICGECAKFHKRIYSKQGKYGFPDMQIFVDYYNKRVCDCPIVFYPYFGLEPTITDSAHAVQYSNRPFVDDRTPKQKKEYNDYIKKQADEIKDRQDYDWIWEHLPDIAPKSYGGYRNMKHQNSKNYQKLVAAAKDQGYMI